MGPLPGGLALRDVACMRYGRRPERLRLEAERLDLVQQRVLADRRPSAPALAGTREAETTAGAQAEPRRRWIQGGRPCSCLESTAQATTSSSASDRGRGRTRESAPAVGSAPARVRPPVRPARQPRRPARHPGVGAPCRSHVARARRALSALGGRLARRASAAVASRRRRQPDRTARPELLGAACSAARWSWTCSKASPSSWPQRGQSSSPHRVDRAARPALRPVELGATASSRPVQPGQPRPAAAVGGLQPPPELPRPRRAARAPTATYRPPTAASYGQPAVTSSWRRTRSSMPGAASAGWRCRRGRARDQLRLRAGGPLVGGVQLACGPPGPRGPGPSYSWRSRSKPGSRSAATCPVLGACGDAPRGIGGDLAAAARAAASSASTPGRRDRQQARSRSWSLRPHGRPCGPRRGPRRGA